MLSNDWTSEPELDYAGRVCGCPNCKRLAACAADILQAKRTFSRAYEALSDTSVLRVSSNRVRPE